MNSKHLKTAIGLSLIGCLGLVLWSTSCKQAPKMDVDNTVLEKEAMSAYAENPQFAADLLKQVAKNYVSEKSHKKAGMTYLNIAGIYDEQLHDYEKAYGFGRMAFDQGVKDQDTLAQANLLKYLGYLNGLIGNVEMGKKEIQFAIDLFKQQEYPAGIAVSHFNLARVYFMDNNLEKSRIYFEKANDFWYSKGDQSRIFTNNNFGITLYDALADLDKRDALIAENDSLNKENDFPPMFVESFEKIRNKVRPE